MQDGNQIAMSHSATLFEIKNGFILFEKVNPEEPYVAVKFSDVDEIKTYLLQASEPPVIRLESWEQRLPSYPRLM